MDELIEQIQEEIDTTQYQLRELALNMYRQNILPQNCQYCKVKLSNDKTTFDWDLTHHFIIQEENAPIYLSCCGNIICETCNYTNQMILYKNNWKNYCPFNCENKNAIWLFHKDEHFKCRHCCKSILCIIGVNGRYLGHY